MNKLGIILVLTMILLTTFWVWMIIGPQQKQSDQAQPILLTKQSDDRGDVIVVVTPIILKQRQEAKFDVALDTHSVELSYDLLTVSSLNDDKGNSLKPLSWSGGTGGHHLKGQLVFPPLSAKAKSVKLVIAGISGFDWKFIWNL